MNITTMVCILFVYTRPHDLDKHRHYSYKIFQIQGLGRGFYQQQFSNCVDYLTTLEFQAVYQQLAWHIR